MAYTSEQLKSLQSALTSLQSSLSSLPPGTNLGTTGTNIASSLSNISSGLANRAPTSTPTTTTSSGSNLSWGGVSIPTSSSSSGGYSAPTTSFSSYTIKPGDTLSGIAAKSGTTVSALMQANPGITNPNVIYAGNNLVIPTASSSSVSGGGSNTGTTGITTPTPPITPTPPTTPTPTITTDQPTIPTYNWETVDRTIPTTNVEATLAAALYTPTQEEDIRKRFLDAVQPWVDTINQQTNLLINEQNRLQQEQLGQNRAMLARSGLVGGTEEMRTTADINQYQMNKKQELYNAQQQKIQAIQAEARKMAEENIAANKNLALKASEQKFSQANIQLLTAASTKKTEADIENIKNTMAIQAQQMKLDNRDKAIALIKELGTANADWDTLDYTTKKTILGSSGLNEKMADLIMNSYKDAANRIDWKITILPNDQAIGIGVDPRTGNPVQETWDLPAGFSKKLEGNKFDIKDGIAWTYKVDANGNMVPGTLSYDPSAAVTLSNIKINEALMTNAAKDNVASLDSDTKDHFNLMTSQLNTYTEDQKQEILDWLTTPPQAVAEKRQTFFNTIKQSMSYEKLMDLLNKHSY
mgnify:CR=1 FL=1